jgi:hypothetical protein
LRQHHEAGITPGALEAMQGAQKRERSLALAKLATATTASADFST